jgi:hypothetical protein
LQKEFEVPLYAFDFAGLAEMLMSVTSARVPPRGAPQLPALRVSG